MKEFLSRLIPGAAARWYLRRCVGADSGFFGRGNRRFTEEFGEDWPALLAPAMRKGS